jgi:CRP-like cAMP-binding protein
LCAGEEFVEQTSKTGSVSNSSRFSGAPGVAPANRLLVSLPPRDFAIIRPSLEPVVLKTGEILQEPHRMVEHAYFFESGAASLFFRTKQDGLVGIAVIGRYGLAGIPIVLGTAKSPHRCVVQIPGRALRISSADLQTAMWASPPLRQVLNCYVQALLVQHGQICLCVSRHRLDQRLSSWLLTVADRVESDDIQITHDLVARMLGVRRATITIAVRHLQQSGALQGNRGHIAIIDRRKLEASSCECYKNMALEYERLLGSHGRATEQRKAMPPLYSSSRPSRQPAADSGKQLPMGNEVNNPLVALETDRTAGKSLPFPPVPHGLESPGQAGYGQKPHSDRIKSR